MSQRSQFVIYMFALILLGRRVTAQTPPAEDFQQWTNVAASWQIKPKLAISTFGEVHLGNDVSQVDQELASVGVIYPLSRWVSIGTGYLYLHANPKLSGISSENRMYFEATFSAPRFHGFLLSDRVRPELRWERAPTGATFTQRYRNRVILERPINKYSPYAMWERFYDATVESWSRTRYYGGITRSIDERTSIQFYFMRQNDGYFRPFHKNVVGISAMFKFRSAHGRHPDE